MKRRNALIVFALVAGAATISVRAMTGTTVNLNVDANTMAALESLRKGPKFLDLPGAPAAQERLRLEPLIDALLDRLLAGIESNPTDAWVFEQMTPAVEAFYLEDTEARERCVDYLARIFRILGITSDRGAFVRFMISV